MTRHALLVGIDVYPGFPDCNQLASCAGDARLMAEVLRDGFEFPPKNVELLLNEEATRQGILDALEGLARRVRRDDVVVFFYSGHGSEARDRAGARGNPEADEAAEWEQTLVPHDSGRDGRKPYRDIRDDELYLWIRQVNETTPHVTVILDSCHAGTAVRSSVRTKQVPREEHPDRNRAPDFEPFRLGETQVQRSAVPAGKRWRDVGPSGWLPVDERYTLLAACRYSESAKEYNVPGVPDLKHGALTYFLARELRALRPGATYRDLMEKVRLAVTGVYPTQTPQVEGARDREVFGTRRVQPPRFLPVKERDGARVVLGGGAAFGLTHGSEWAVYPPGTHRVEEGVRPRGQVRIKSVRAVTSEAEVIEEAGDGGPVAVGDRAIEAIHREDLQVPVVIGSHGAYGRREDQVAALVHALEARIDDSLLLRRAQEGEPAAIELRGLEAGGGDLGEGSTGRCEGGDQPAWAMFGEDGTLLVCPCPMFEVGSTRRVIDNLEARARFLHVLNLEDRDPTNPLRDTLEVTFLRRGRGGHWTPARSEGPEGEIAFTVKEEFALEVVHHFDHRLYLHVLDLGLTGGVCPLYPVPGEHQPQEPNRPLRIGVRQGEGLKVGMPPGFPAVTGRERIKVFATTHEADFEWLRQKRYRDAGKRSALERVLGATLRGGELREATPVAPTAEEHWTVVTKSFLVHRAPS